MSSWRQGYWSKLERKYLKTLQATARKGQPALPAKGAMMKARILIALVPVLLLSACGQDEPAKQQEKTFGGSLGDAYRGALDDARQGVDNANEQMQRTDQALRERDR